MCFRYEIFILNLQSVQINQNKSQMMHIAVMKKFSELLIKSNFSVYLKTACDYDLKDLLKLTCFL